MRPSAGIKRDAGRQQTGGPDFHFVEDPDYGANSFGKIGLHPRLKLDKPTIARLRELGHKGPLRGGEELTGVQFCNLATVPAASPPLWQEIIPPTSH